MSKQSLHRTLLLIMHYRLSKGTTDMLSVMFSLRSVHFWNVNLIPHLKYPSINTLKLNMVEVSFEVGVLTCLSPLAYTGKYTATADRAKYSPPSVMYYIWGLLCLSHLGWYRRSTLEMLNITRAKSTLIKLYSYKHGTCVTHYSLRWRLLCHIQYIPNAKQTSSNSSLHVERWRSQWRY